MEDLKKYNFIYNLAMAIDKLLNVIAGGTHDSTISARVGYHALHHRTWYWVAMEKMIDFTFSIAGDKNHCFNAYLFDPDGKVNRGNWVAQAVLAWLTFGCCVALLPLFGFWKKIKRGD